MSALALTIYVLMWPVIVGGTLFVISRSFLREAAEARRNGADII